MSHFCVKYVVKHIRHNPLQESLQPELELDSLRSDAVAAEEGVEVGAVDVDFAADLGEGDDAAVAVGLPRLG